MMNRKNRIILEWTEFSLQRFNAHSPTGYPNVDDPQLSVNAFDKHQDSIRQALSRINDILLTLKSSSDYTALRSKLGLEDQDIQGLKILRIVKNNEVTYDVYVAFAITDNEYWGKVTNILGYSPKLSSEVFKDYDLFQPKEWVIKIEGLIIKAIKNWLKPPKGKYRVINNQIIARSSITGESIVIEKDSIIELTRSFDDKILITFNNKDYSLHGDNMIYFNWWLEPLE